MSGAQEATRRPVRQEWRDRERIGRQEQDVQNCWSVFVGTLASAVSKGEDCFEQKWGTSDF